ncbi:response regulator transcription factor [Streptomyces xantholiticus]|uniref:response regulator transcription factor n=1 Tax=Streptomyces xantholiticus TaxID=68285 RepID=UPI003570B830
MASRGVQSQEIAKHLVLSVRTVDNHLQRIYQKLGITRRSQLPSALAPMAADAPAGGARADAVGWEPVPARQR